MSQKQEKIKIQDLVLWTENPRDPIDPNATDQDIANVAWGEKKEKWALLSLISLMGPYYDQSELPTVVFMEGKPVVYDGNRRMILCKVRLGYITLDGLEPKDVPDCETELTCNICDEQTALKNIYRKHGKSGSWTPLDQDVFVHKFMKKPKSPFLIIEEKTGLISSHKDLNQDFVRREIFRSDKLKEVGIEIDEEFNLLSKHSDEETFGILQDIANKIIMKHISTRGNNRGKVFESLSDENKNLVAANRENELQAYASAASRDVVPVPGEESQKTRRPRRTGKTDLPPIFGGKLTMQEGQVGDLYRDIEDLYDHYVLNQTKFSSYFPSFIRMALRLFAETAAQGKGKKMDAFIKAGYPGAKKKLDQKAKTFISMAKVDEDNIVQLLHLGAHNYHSSNNLETTIAISIILGAIVSDAYAVRRSK